MISVEVLWIVISVLILCLALLAGLFVYLLFKKQLIQRQHNQIMGWTQQFLYENSLLNEYVHSGNLSRSFRYSSPIRRDAVQNALYQEMGLSRSPEFRGEITRFAEQHLTPHYRAMLRARSWSVRLNALLYIEHFRISTLNEELERLLEHPRCTDLERFIVIRIFALLQRPEIIDDLMKREVRFSDFQWIQILNHLSMQQLMEMVGRNETLPLHLLQNLIDILRIRNERSEPILAFFEHAADHEQSEVRIRALNALANFGYMSREGISDLLRHTVQADQVPWKERLLRAKVMGSIKESQFLEYLESLLTDPVIQVRQQAAETMLQYKEGRQRLQHKDQLIREIIEEVMERENYERNRV